MKNNILFNKRKETMSSPFLYYSGYERRVFKTKSMTRNEVDSILNEKGFTADERKVLDALSTYLWLNNYLLSKCVSIAKSTGNEINYIKGITERLFKFGIIEKFSFHYTSSKGEDASSPFFFTLSEVGRKAYKKMVGEKKYAEMLISDRRRLAVDDVDILCSMTLSQFHIMLKRQYECSKFFLYSEYFGRAWEEAQLPTVYKLKTEKGLEINLFVFAIRSNDGWSKQFLEKVREIKEYANKNNIFAPVILTICETEYQAMDAARKLDCDSTIRQLRVYYATDTTFLTEPNVFDRMIEILPKNDYSTRRIFRLNLKDNQNTAKVLEKA